LIPFAFGASGDSQERGREHGQGDVPVPSSVGTDLVVIQPSLIFGELECFLDTPTGSGHPDKFDDRNRVASVADVVGQLGGPANRATHQQQMLIRARVQYQPVIQTVAFASLPGRKTLPAGAGASAASSSARRGPVGVANLLSQDTAIT
jgi:hypothetical protein